MSHRVFVQATGVLATGAYTAVATLAILKVVSMVTDLRVAPDDETMGLDISEHEERGYYL